MPTTRINRVCLTDDDGTGVNGTILNNEFLQRVYDSIEKALPTEAPKAICAHCGRYGPLGACEGCGAAVTPQGIVAVAVGVGIALAESPRRLTRRGFLGLR